MKRVRESLPITDPNLKQALMEYGHAINGLKNLFKEDADGNEYLDKIRDANGDTYVEVTDDDIIHFYTAGSEIGQFNSNGLNLAVGKGLIDADGDTYVTVEKTADEDVIHFYTAGSEKVAIDDSGNVTLNSSSTVSYLTFGRHEGTGVKRELRLFDISGGNIYGLRFDGGNYYTAILANDNEGLVVKQNGYVGIGTNNPDKEFVIHKSSGGCNAKISSGNDNAALLFTANNAHRFAFWVDKNASYRLNITDAEWDNGVYLAQNSNAWSSYSDVRMKKDIKDLSSVLSIIAKFKVRKFKWKHNNKEDVGLIAQEVKSIYPYIVTGKEDEYKADKKGRVKGQMGIMYSMLTPLLLKGIQELNDKLNNLQEQINDIRQSATKKSVN